MKLLRQEVLSDLEYYGMRLSGTEDLKIHKGLEVGQELDKIIIYGDIAEQYSKLGNKRQV